MIDDLPPQLDADAIRALIAENPDWWAVIGADAPSDPPVEILGRGESAVVTAVGELAVSVPHRPLAELDAPLQEQLAPLGRVPAGLAAIPVAAHTPTPQDPRAYVVTSRVRGRALAAGDWDDALRARLAERLAGLHVQGVRSGLVDGGPIDPVAEAEGAMSWWRENVPASAKVLEPLWPAVLEHQQQAGPAFTGVPRTLVHGDVSLPNVLVDEEGTPRLVDWEWSHLGDPARDLAYLGGPIHAAPWYGPLEPDQITALLDAYAAARERFGDPVDRHALGVRRAAWLLHETFFTSAHFHRVGAAGGPESRRYHHAGEELRAQISAYLKDC